MKLSAFLLVLASLAVASMRHVYSHSFPNPDTLPENVETSIRRSAFLLGMLVEPLALTLALKGWIGDHEGTTKIRRGLGLTAIVLVSTAWLHRSCEGLSLFIPFIRHYQLPWIPGLDFVIINFLYLALALSFLLKDNSRVLAIAAVLFQVAFDASFFSV